MCREQLYHERSTKYLGKSKNQGLAITKLTILGKVQMILMITETISLEIPLIS